MQNIIILMKPANSNHVWVMQINKIDVKIHDYDPFGTCSARVVT